MLHQKLWWPLRLNAEAFEFNISCAAIFISSHFLIMAECSSLIWLLWPWPLLVKINHNIWLTLFSWSNMLSSRTNANPEWVKDPLSSEETSSLWTKCENECWQFWQGYMVSLYWPNISSEESLKMALLSVSSYEPTHWLLSELLCIIVHVLHCTISTRVVQDSELKNWLLSNL